MAVVHRVFAGPGRTCSDCGKPIEVAKECVKAHTKTKSKDSNEPKYTSKYYHTTCKIPKEP